MLHVNNFTTRRYITISVVLLTLALGVLAVAQPVANALAPELCALSSVVHLYRGVVLTRSGQLDEAEDALRKALSLEPDHRHDQVAAKLDGEDHQGGFACFRLELDHSKGIRSAWDGLSANDGSAETDETPDRYETPCP